jgi:CDP-diacylglycerol pyrophosphatase
VKLRNFGLALMATAGLAATAAVAAAGGHDRDRLRFIVQQQCLPHWRAAHDPAPCLSLHSLGTRSGSRGYALLRDQKGGAHFLLIPTRTISGIESTEVRAAGAPNYFGDAWNARDVLTSVIGHSPRRSAVGMAVNSIRSRSQDQLHIHIACLRPYVYAAFQAASAQLGKSWSPLSIGDRHYQAMRVMGRQLGTANPFELLADGLPGAKAAMDQYTLLVAGMEFKEGPGFVLLAGASVPGAESLLDSSCVAAD